jgi:hypothetical protein
MTPQPPEATDGTATGAVDVSPFAAPAGEGELIDIGTAAFWSAPPRTAQAVF